MIPHKMSSIIKSIHTPTARELQGRGLAVRLSRGLHDVCYVTVYCPLGGQDAQAIRMTEKLWQWVALVRSSLPARTHMIIGVDANGHVGSKRYRMTIQLEEGELDDARDIDYPYIGPYGMEEENANGELMREFLEQQNMLALNTWDVRASGKTWTVGKSSKTRVDYILQTMNEYDERAKVCLAPAMRKMLRAAAGLEDGDHIPLRFCFRMKPWTNTRVRASNATYGYAAMTRSCIMWDDKARIFTDRVRQLFHDEWMSNESSA